ncbi:Odorant receptor 50 [Operophtera brumata]|uniref:Odorant receptor n=1 Tax=Operophtera brumata TaxID=104452 RepID=A0A0L7LGZ8_OPEBR|nr:Odorant receptor 50 [Operophtera brumata]
MLETVRKFGLGHCDLPTMLWNVSFMLRALTLHIDTRNNKRISPIFYVITSVAIACYFYVYLVSMVWFVFCRCMETGNVLAALIVFSLGISSEIGIVKLFFMFLYIDNVQQIVAECLANDALVVLSSRFSKNLLKTLRNVKKRAMMFWIVIINNGIVYIVKPLLLPGRHIMEDLFIIYGLEPTYESPNYELAFFLMSIGVCVTCYLPANITAFLIVITGYVEAQMLSWSEEMIHLWEDAENNYIRQHLQPDNNVVVNDPMDKEKHKVLNEYVSHRLKVIIAGHAANINILRQIEEIFRGAIALEFCLLIIGLIVELLGGLENTYMEIPFALVQVAMDCLAGQRVMDASMVFERAVYDCKWENFDKNNMKIVLLMLQNSQKTMTLSAGGITKLSFVSLMAVIKSVYSAYTTLRSTMK